MGAGKGGGSRGASKGVGVGVVKDMSEKVSWVSPRGEKIDYEVKIITEKTSNLDGDKITSPTMELQESFRINGIPQTGELTPLTSAQKQKYPGYAYRYGNIALTQEQTDKMKSAMTKVSSNPSYQKRQKEISDTIAKNQRERSTYEKSLRNVIGGYKDPNTY